MLSKNRYLAIVRASAIYDLVVTAAFATPWTFAALLGILATIDAQLGLPGSISTPETFVILLGNLLGSIVVVWSILRIRLNLPVLGRYDAVARFLFAAWQFNAMLNGASWLVAGFLIIELAFGVAQLLPYEDAEKASIDN